MPTCDHQEVPDHIQAILDSTPEKNWLTNIAEPEADEFRKNNGGTTHQGPPRATGKHSVQDLLKMGMVGIYRVLTPSLIRS